MPRTKDILNFWFGNTLSSDLPSSERTQLWFGENNAEEVIREKFAADLKQAKLGQYDHWAQQPRSALALILLLDQFNRCIHWHTPEAFAYDEKAQQLCLDGMDKKMERQLSLLERAFFYMPMVHAEDRGLQNYGVGVYQELVEISLPEASEIFQGFLDYSLFHCNIVERFGRFPQRNVILNRETTVEELKFLEELKENLEHHE